ncbi:ATP-dependent RNA helicase ddx46 [Hondaea fermentalgiana]|uniref:RNA helicase n=1 Tax=Hondaea fermentalgiana TaxID=2315210 RepID=A0A2R5H3C4_9STRA|nr:ATP-dependent RNA helicase ddx46 [Hondaea fermentalgiana]|eukprot:GBG34914.1 ATP-dependent RNA helicase ddx46 [Hondaea fermentalgiana]
MKLKRVGISRARTRNPEDDEDEDEAGHAARRRAQKGAMAFMKRPGDASAAKGPSHAETNDDEANNMDDGEEVDPLDAYMAQLGQSASGSGSGSSLGPARDATENDDAASPAARAITLEEIMSEIKSDVDTAGDANDARDRKKGSGTARKAQREERNEQGSFHAAFLQAARARRAAEEEETRRLRAERAKEAEAASAELQKAEPVVGRGGSAGEDGVGIMGEDDGEQDAVLAELSKPSVSAIDLLKEKARKKELAPVDHSKIEYEPFTKDFYVEAPSLRAMPEGLVDLTRKELEITIRGARPLPKPIEQWAQCGLSDRIMNVLQRRGWETPFAIQRQAIPAIMSGRDLIGVAKTGSGKTLAFVVPMVRHVLDQRALEPGEGPIALIMAPARELAVQINEEVKKFARACQVNSLCCYGGVGVKDQISALKRGVEILVATPGRLIDLLTANNGRLLSLQRVTYIVLDEADRMFDMGFEPQITKVIRNTRPTRQIVMFSATFPPLVERVASEVLKERPTIIVVGGRAKPPSNIKHLVEVREPHDKFPRLLQILGEWYDEDHQILVFVKTQASCDKLFQQLVQIGYSCLTLHGGKDQIDRDNTITDFKNKVTTLMLATGVAARGLDVADLRLVINFDVPNHLEELIHRIGRTGRAGRDGTAFTFIAPDEAMYAPDLVKALRDAKQEIPPEVLALSESYKRKIVAGEAKFRSSGYRGSGFKFTEDEKTASAKQQELLRKAEEVNLGIRGDEDSSQSAVEDPAAAESARHEESVARATRLAEKFAASGAPEQAGGASSSSSSSSNASGAADSALARVRQSVAAAVERVKDASSQFTEFIIINDYPTKVRWKMTHKDTLNAITDKTGAGITVKGQYSAPGTSHTASEPPLFLLVEGGSSYDVARAATELRRILEETTRDVAALPSGTSSRYKVL